jgi:hypothetical protein
MGAFFTATSMIGFIAGAGIIVRNSIILVDFIELRLREGMTLEAAGFVERLLHAAQSAGGRLTLSRRNESGSLIDAIKLLAPYLPAETATKLSFATVRRIREAWLKKQENRPKILLN